MAITFPLTLPTVTGIAQIDIIPNTVVSATTSPFTGTQKIQRQMGQWWESQVVLPPQSKINAPVWEAFILSLNGIEGTFLMGDPRYSEPRGGAKDTAGTPVADGAGQSGQTFNIRGVPNSVTGYLLAGDRIQLGAGITTRYHTVLADADSDGSGLISVDLWPRIRTGDEPIDGAAIVLVDPKCHFRLKSNRNPFSARPGPFTEISFGCREVLE